MRRSAFGNVSLRSAHGVKCRVAQRAGDGTRTHDNDVGNVVLYQLSYTRGKQVRALWRIPKL